MEEYLEGGPDYEHTRDMKYVLGKRVLSKGRARVGKVKEARIEADSGRISGVLVSRGLFKGDVYISEEYIERLAQDAVLLTIDPAFLKVKRKVLASDGKKFATVTGVHRQKDTNKIVSYDAKRWFKTISIPADEVKHASESIILKRNYEQAKSRFTS